MVEHLLLHVKKKVTFLWLGWWTFVSTFRPSLFLRQRPRKIPRVFELVQEFVPEVAASARGRLLLLNGEPGGGMFCLESNRHVGRWCRGLDVHRLSFAVVSWMEESTRSCGTMAHKLVQCSEYTLAEEYRPVLQVLCSGRGCDADLSCENNIPQLLPKHPTKNRASFHLSLPRDEPPPASDHCPPSPD